MRQRDVGAQQHVVGVADDVGRGQLAPLDLGGHERPEQVVDRVSPALLEGALQVGEESDAGGAGVVVGNRSRAQRDERRPVLLGQVHELAEDHHGEDEQFRSEIERLPVGPAGDHVVDTPARHLLVGLERGVESPVERVPQRAVVGPVGDVDLAPAGSVVGTDAVEEDPPFCRERRVVPQGVADVGEAGERPVHPPVPHHVAVHRVPLPQGRPQQMGIPVGVDLRVLEVDRLEVDRVDQVQVDRADPHADRHRATTGRCLIPATKLLRRCSTSPASSNDSTCRKISSNISLRPILATVCPTQ